MLKAPVTGYGDPCNLSRTLCQLQEIVMEDGQASVGESTAGEMKLVGGRLCLDFTNTVGGRKDSPMKSGAPAPVLRDKLKSYADLAAWGRHTGLVTEVEAQSLIRESKRRVMEAAAVLE